jgi:hypothetical protein
MQSEADVERVLRQFIRSVVMLREQAQRTLDSNITEPR